MGIISSMLRQKAVYWASPENDGYGNFTFDDPVEIDCRWEEKAESYFKPNGTEAQSLAIVYVDRDVDIGGYLQFGELADVGSANLNNPEDDPDSYRIEQKYKLPNFRISEYLRIAFL